MKKVYKQFSVEKPEWNMFGYRTLSFYECYTMYLVEHHADCDGEALDKDYILMLAHYKWWVFFPLLFVLPFVLILFGVKGGVYYCRNTYHLCISKNEHIDYHKYEESLSNSYFHNLKLILECQDK